MQYHLHLEHHSTVLINVIRLCLYVNRKTIRTQVVDYAQHQLKENVVVHFLRYVSLLMDVVCT